MPYVFNPLIWKCNTEVLVDQYNSRVGARHIDLGPGTGWFLRRFADRNPHRLDSLLLVDENQASLNYACNVLSDLSPAQLKLDLSNTDSVNQLKDKKANSVSASYLLHCLPRGLRDSDAMLEAISQVIGSDGVLFGSVILPDLARCRIRSRFLCWFLNALGIFGNRADSVEELKVRLAKHFSRCDVRTVQCVALFSVDNRRDNVRSQ